MPVKKPWNGRALYLRHQLRDTVSLQHALLAELSSSYPAEVEGLWAVVGPLWREAVAALKAEKARNRTPYAHIADEESFWSEVLSRPQVPACARATAALHSWTQQLGLEAPWVRVAARHLMWTCHERGTLAQHGWYIPHLESDVDDLDRTGLGIWDPRDETLDDFKKRIERHIKRQQTWALRRGLMPQLLRRESRGRDLRHRLRWVLMSRVERLTFKQIADQEAEAGAADVTPSGIRYEVRELEGALELGELAIDSQLTHRPNARRHTRAHAQKAHRSRVPRRSSPP